MFLNFKDKKALLFVYVQFLFRVKLIKITSSGKKMFPFALTTHTHLHMTPVKVENKYEITSILTKVRISTSVVLDCRISF